MSESVTSPFYDQEGIGVYHYGGMSPQVLYRQPGLGHDNSIHDHELVSIYWLLYRLYVEHDKHRHSKRK